MDSLLLSAGVRELHSEPASPIGSIGYRTVIFTYTSSIKTTPVPSMGLVYLPTWKWLILTHKFVGEQNHTWSVPRMSHAPVEFNKAQGTSEEDKTQTCQKRYSDRQWTRHCRFFLRWLSSWWFQPSWKILLKLDHPPQIGLKIKNAWNHLVVCVLLRFTSFPFCCSFCGKENDRMLHVYLHVPLSQCKCWWSWIVLQAKQESDCVCVCHLIEMVGNSMLSLLLLLMLLLDFLFSA